MRILITGPDDSLVGTDKKLTEELCAEGHTAVHRPLIRLVPTSPVSLPNLSDYTAVVCVSRHAAHYFFQLFAGTPKKLPGKLPEKLPPFFVPGTTTAAYLTEAHKGISVLCPTDGVGSEAILKMPEWIKLAKLAKLTETCQGDAKILILCGEDGRELLNTKLKQANVRVEKLVLYKPVICQYDAAREEREQEFSLVWVTSGHILRGLKEQRYPWLPKATLVLPSERLAKLAEQLAIKSGKIIILKDAYGSTLTNYIKGLGVRTGRADGGKIRKSK